MSLNKRPMADRDAKIITLRKHGLIPMEIHELIGDALGITMENITHICQAAGYTLTPAEQKRLHAIKAKRQVDRQFRERAEEYARDRVIADHIRKGGKSTTWVMAHYRLTDRQVRTLVWRVTTRERRRDEIHARYKQEMGL